jgi:hypothetical protein
VNVVADWGNHIDSGHYSRSVRHRCKCECVVDGYTCVFVSVDGASIGLARFPSRQLAFFSFILGHV